MEVVNFTRSTHLKSEYSTNRFPIVPKAFRQRSRSTGHYYSHKKAALE